MAETWWSSNIQPITEPLTSPPPPAGGPSVLDPAALIAEAQELRAMLALRRSLAVGAALLLIGLAVWTLGSRLWGSALIVAGVVLIVSAVAQYA